MTGCFRALLLLASLLAAHSAVAATYKLSRESSPEVRFTVDAPLDSIVGVSRTVKGSVTFDPDTLAFGPGEVSADARTFQTGIGLRDEDLRDQFFEADRFPEIVLTLQKLSRTSASKLPAGARLQADVTGELNVHGVSRSVTFSATFNRGADGRIVIVHGSFPVVLADYGIKRPQRLFLKLGEVAQVDVRATFVAAEPENAPAAGAPAVAGANEAGAGQLQAPEASGKPVIAPPPPAVARRFSRKSLPREMAAHFKEHVEHFAYPFNTAFGRGERLFYDPTIGGAGNAATCAGCHGTGDERYGFVDDGIVHPSHSLYDAAYRPAYWQGFAPTIGKAASICAKMFMLKPDEGLDEGKQADLTAYLDRISPDKGMPLIDYRVLNLTRKDQLDRPLNGNAQTGRKLEQRFCEGCHSVGGERPPLTPGSTRPTIWSSACGISRAPTLARCRRCTSTGSPTPSCATSSPTWQATPTTGSSSASGWRRPRSRPRRSSPGGVPPIPGYGIVNTTRGCPAALDQVASMAESGTVRVAISSFAGPTASNTWPMPASSFDIGTLFRPLPISSMADERSAAPGSEIESSPLAPPTWTKRTGCPDSTARATATMTVRALSPHR